MQDKINIILDVDKEIFIRTFCDYLHTRMPVNRIIFEAINNSFGKYLSHPLIKNWKLKKSLAEYGIKNFSLSHLANNGIDIYYVTVDINTCKNIQCVEIENPIFSIYSDFDYGYNKIKITIKKKELKTINKFIVEIKHLSIQKEFFYEIYNHFAELCIDKCCDKYLQDKYDIHFWIIGFECKICGKIHICSCFKSAIEATSEINNVNYKDGICHVCTKRIPNKKYSYAGFSAFKIRYFPYIENIIINKRKNNLCTNEYFEKEDIAIERNAENEIREMVGYPKIGEKWINETHLYKMICFLFEGYEVLREASPPWLGKLRLDMFIPQLNLAIEYQGEQHYIAVSRFGGEDGLIKTQNRDKIKNQLCKTNGVHVIYFKYDEEITDALVEKRLAKFIQYIK